MGRHRMKLALSRKYKIRKSLKRSHDDVLREDTSKCDTQPCHSTPFKQRKVHFDSVEVPPLSPIELRVFDEKSCSSIDETLPNAHERTTDMNSDDSITTTNSTCQHGNCSTSYLCIRCGHQACTTKHSNCTHDFSMDALCHDCGTFYEQSRPHIETVSLENEATSERLKNDDRLWDIFQNCQSMLQDKGFPAFLPDLLNAIASGTLDTEGLTFAIFSETIHALTSNNLSQLRYSRKSKCFWKLFLSKCGGMGIRLLSGWKCIGSVLTGEATRGSIYSDNLDIILAIPSEDCLRKFDPYGGDWPRKISTGFCENLATAVARTTSDTSVCLSLDGKKLTPGLTGEKGDIDLLGKEEDCDSLEKRSEMFMEEQTRLARISQAIYSNSLSRNLPLIEALQWCITLFSKLSVRIIEESQKKTYALAMLKKRAGDDYKKSRYGFVIHLVLATLVELQQCQSTNCNLRDKLIQTLASLQGKDSIVVPSRTTLALGDISNYCALPDIDRLLASDDAGAQAQAFLLEEMGSAYIKQRSVLWFEKRKEAPVTASQLFAATGAESLSALKEHCLRTFRGKERPPFSPEVQKAVDHGQTHEKDAMATFCIKFLSAFHTTATVYEIGCVEMTASGVKLVISPDGLVADTASGDIVAVVEIKCPYVAPLHINIPVRYYLQVQAQIMAMNVQYAYYISYKDKTTRVFRIEKDNETWDVAVECLVSTFVNNSGKIPKKVPRRSKGLLKMLKEKTKSNCVLLAEVSSVKVTAPEEEIITWPATPLDDITTTHIYSDPFVTELPDINLDWDAKLASSLLDTAIAHHSQVHQLLRKKATEVVTMVASDTDRLWSRNQKIGSPLCYFLKGYSLSMSVMRNILEDTLDKAFKSGIHIPCVSFDGQFMKLLREDIHGNAQTVLQLQKSYWMKVSALSKGQLLSEINDVTELKTISDVLCEVETHTVEGRTVKRLNMQYSIKCAVPQTATAALKHKSARSYNNIEHNKITDDLTALEGDLNSVLTQTEVESVIQKAQDFSENQPTGSKEYDDTSIQEDNEQNVTDINRDYDDENTEQSPGLLTNDHFLYLLQDLQNEIKCWETRSVENIRTALCNCDQLSKLKVGELKVVGRFLKQQFQASISLSASKHSLLTQITTALQLTGSITYKPCQRRHKSVISLKQQTVMFLKNHYPKTALKVSYENWKFPSFLQDWRDSAHVKSPMTISEVDSRKIVWFYVPEFSSRKQLEVKKIDPHHLLTRHRSAICKGDLGFAKRKHFLEVALDNSTPLNAGMMEEQLNMQSTDYAKITFSYEVEMQLKSKQHHGSADLCKYVREWFEACDVPGIPAVERCMRKLRYRDYLLSLADLKAFPPAGSHIRGYPVPLWESTAASVDADLFLYALSRRGTYNNRSLSSQPCECLYSCLATMPGARNGVPSCVDLEVNMAKICGESLLRHDPTRGFSLRLSSAPVYPQSVLEIDAGPLPSPKNPPTYIDEIHITDHLFDVKSRKRRAQPRPRGMTSLHQPGCGGVGVRHYHKVNECKINPLLRAGFTATDVSEATGVKK